VINIFFALLGSALVKAAHKMLMKLTPGVNFTNSLAINAKALMLVGVLLNQLHHQNYSQLFQKTQPEFTLNF